MCYERGFYLENWREKGVACNGLPTTVLGKEQSSKKLQCFSPSSASSSETVVREYRENAVVFI